MAGFEPVTFRVTVGATSPICRFPRPDAGIRLWTRRCDLLWRDEQRIRRVRPMFRKEQCECSQARTGALLKTVSPYRPSHVGDHASAPRESRIDGQHDIDALLLSPGLVGGASRAVACPYDPDPPGVSPTAPSSPSGAVHLLRLS